MIFNMLSETLPDALFDSVRLPAAIGLAFAYLFLSSGRRFAVSVCASGCRKES